MKKKNVIKLLGAASMLALTLTACGSKNDSANANTSKSEEITIMAPFIETAPPSNNNDLLKKIEDFTDEKINFNWVPNTNYQDKMNMTLASDSVPQVMVIQQKSGAFIKSAESGTFWDLSDKLKDYPNLSQADDAILMNSSVNGKVYGIYRNRDLVRSSVIIRKDWLDKLGLEMPKNTEDLYNIAKAFTEQDPDGNGKDDTTGIIIPQWPGSINTSSPYDMIATWFGAGNAWKEENGKFTPSFQTEEYLESLDYIKDMIDNGYINRDFATLAADKWNDPFISGKGGIILDTYSRAMSINSLIEQGGEEGSEVVTFTGNLAGPDGNVYAFPTDGYSGFLAIPKASVKTEEELDRVLTFLDKLNEKEAQILLNNGIEGVNFEVTDGKAVRINEGDSKADEIFNATKSYSQIGMNVTTQEEFYKTRAASEDTQALEDRRYELMDQDAEKVVMNPAAPYAPNTYSTKGAQLDQIIQDARIKYIAGQIDKKGWQDAIDLWSKSGGADLIKELNELAAGN